MKISGWLVASWDDLAGGGITTQGAGLRELQAQVQDAVRCSFEPGEAPSRIRLYIVTDPVLMDS